MLPVIVIYFLPQQSRYYLDLGTLILTYVMLGWGLNIVVGLAGLLDLGYVAFYAVGAYSFALLAFYFGLELLDLPAARRHSRRHLGHDPRLPGAPAPRRLPRPRHPRLRRDHPARPDQLVRLHRRPERHLQHSRGRRFFGIEFDRGPGGFAEVFGLTFSPNHRIIWLYYIILVLALVTGS